MIPHMSKNERELFLSFIKHTNRYIEFGCGGSTIFASVYVKEFVYSVDSSPDWINKVREESHGFCVPDFLYVNIGPVGDWGTPIDLNEKHRWPNYHSYVWNMKDSYTADLYFIDGRFRVACFAQIYKRVEINTIIGVHDFASRQNHYHPINELGRPIASVEDLTFFLPIPDNKRRAHEILKEYEYNYR